MRLSLILSSALLSLLLVEGLSMHTLAADTPKTPQKISSKFFSVELPEGWVAISPLYYMENQEEYHFSKKGSDATLILLFTRNTDLATLKEEQCKKLREAGYLVKEEQDRSVTTLLITGRDRRYRPDAPNYPPNYRVGLQQIGELTVMIAAGGTDRKELASLLDALQIIFSTENGTLPREITSTFFSGTVPSDWDVTRVSAENPEEYRFTKKDSDARVSFLFSSSKDSTTLQKECLEQLRAAGYLVKEGKEGKSTVLTIQGRDRRYRPDAPNYPPHYRIYFTQGSSVAVQVALGGTNLDDVKTLLKAITPQDFAIPLFPAAWFGTKTSS